MKKLFLATVETNTQRYSGVGDRRDTRIIPVYAEEREDVDRLVREAFEGDGHNGDRTSVLDIRVEEPIGSPD